MPSFLYLAPGNERCVVDRLSDIDYNVQFTNPTAGRIAPRLPYVRSLIEPLSLNGNLTFVLLSLQEPRCHLALTTSS